MLRTAVCSLASAPGTSVIGAQGTPAASNRTSQSAAGRLRSATSRSARSTSRWRSRAALSTYAGRSASSGRPMVAHSERKNPSLAAQMVTGPSAPARIGNAHYSIAPFDTYACADGPVTICAANDGFFRSLCATIGRPELAERPAYVDNAARDRHREVLRADLEVALRSRPAADWLVRLEAAGVPCAPITDVPGALASEQTAVRNMVITAGDYRLPGTPMKFSAYPDPETRPVAPALDADGDRIRAEFSAG